MSVGGNCRKGEGILAIAKRNFYYADVMPLVFQEFP
jgi:hypothetical protein